MPEVRLIDGNRLAELFEAAAERGAGVLATVYRDAAHFARTAQEIKPEVRLIPKEVSATDIDKLTEMIKGSLLQAYPNDVMFTAVRHGRWEKVPYISHCGCGKKFDVFRYNCSECNRTSEFQAYGLRFCPYCGADNGDAIKGGADNG